MYKFFGILLLSLLFTGVLLIPFIDLLYALRFRQKPVKSIDYLGRKTLYNKLHGWKVGTPIGGGILIILAAFLFSFLFYALTAFQFNWTSHILFLTLFSFGALGFYDDVRKFFRLYKKGIRALPAAYKFLLQTVLAALIAYLLFTQMGLHTIRLPALGPIIGLETIELGWLYIPFAALVILSSSNAFNITDGLDGLATGLLMIALSAYWYLATLSPFAGDIMLFIAVLLGALAAFLYFNIYPARLFMGDTGALAFGAMLAVVALMTQQTLILIIIGGVFVIEGLSSTLQLLSMRFRNGKKIFKIAPLHHHLEAIGWDETKITMRFWLLGTVLAFVGLFLATLDSAAF